MKRAKEIGKEYGLDSKKLSDWEAEASKGKLPGVSIDEIITGRPRLFGAALKPVVFKETEQRIVDIDKRAASLGRSRSEYLRYLVEKDLTAI